MCLRSRRRSFGMPYANILALLVVFFSILLPAQSLNNTSKQKHDSLDTLLNGIVGEIPRKDSSKFFSQLFKIEKETKNHFTISPTKDEPGTKKSTEATPSPDPHDNAAVSVALSKPSVYFVDLGLKTQAESSRTQEYNTAKRFRIPQLKPRLQRNRILPTHQKDDDKPDTPFKYDSIIYIHPKDRTEDLKNTTPDKSMTSITDPKATVPEDVTESHERRAKRQEGSSLSEGFPILSSTTNAGIQTLPVQTLNTIIPSQSNIVSDVNAVADNKVVAMVPVKMEAPLDSSPSVAMISQTLVQPDALGTSRSTLPVTTLIQTSPHESANTLRSPHVGNLFLKLSDQHNRFATSYNQDSRLKVTPGEENENEVIKLAQVPLSFFNEKTKQFKHKKISAYEHSNSIKLDQLSIKPSVETKDAEKLKTNSKEKTQEDINKETLETLQSRLTNIISKLEEKVNKHQRRVKQPKKEESLKTIVKKNPSEKSLTLLKNRLSNVLKKFNSKPGAGQPFTIGKEWRNVLKNGPSQGKEAKNTEMKKMKNAKEDDGNWPSIASQLLKKLDKALIKLQEQRVARSLGKNAVMYFSFDKPTTTVANTNAIEDKSDHFNDALTSGRAHTSSRAYGSCGKALILNSGNLRFTTKYFEKKPTKAITLTMWVRTNVTGYVKWFARDSGRSRDFNTHTQYPLVNKNVWTHLCGTYNSSTGITRIYVDGELKTEKVNRQQESIPADFTPAGIGPEFGDENLIAVDEVYMFARALNPKEVRTLYDNCEFNRMVLHYGFQKINRSAGLVFDQSGLHNDGYLQGDAQILDSGCDKCGSCLNLNAKNNPRLSIQATHFKHRPTKAISIGAWFNLNSTTGTHSLFSVTESIFKSTILDLLVTDGKLQWKGYNKDHNTIFKMATTQAVVPEGIWVHILATFDSLHGQAKIFIDGHQKALAKTAKKVPIAEDWSEIKIGGHKSRAQAWGGYIDEFVLYNWELEPSEISYIMKYCPDHPKLVSFTVHVPLD